MLQPTPRLTISHRDAFPVIRGDVEPARVKLSIELSPRQQQRYAARHRDLSAMRVAAQSQVERARAYREQAIRTMHQHEGEYRWLPSSREIRSWISARVGSSVRPQTEMWVPPTNTETPAG